MLNDTDKKKIIRLGVKYKVSRILLFGSSLQSDSNAQDIDLAVEGVQDSDYFKFYGDLIFNLSKPVDLIDLDKKSLFKDIILKEGVVLYAGSERKN